MQSPRPTQVSMEKVKHTLGLDLIVTCKCLNKITEDSMLHIHVELNGINFNLSVTECRQLIRTSCYTHVEV